MNEEKQGVIWKNLEMLQPTLTSVEHRAAAVNIEALKISKFHNFRIVSSDWSHDENLISKIQHKYT